jgi:FlaA1/EpsC-like NDP-sugar epimerase
MKALVTGAGGLIGSERCRVFADDHLRARRNHVKRIGGLP